MIRIQQLNKLGKRTGSVAFGVATHGSDEDWLIVDSDFFDVVRFTPWSFSRYCEGFKSYREGRFNLIIALSRDFHTRWMRAHRHCCIERPRDKKRRIKIFRHYLYGEALA